MSSCTTGGGSMKLVREATVYTPGSEAYQRLRLEYPSRLQPALLLAYFHRWHI
jgi:hypothetical protein